MAGNFEFESLGMLGKSISVQKMTGNGSVYLRITKLYKNDDGEWKPTNKGISIPSEDVPLLVDLLNGFIKKEGISNEAKTVSGSDIESDLSTL